MDDAPDLDLVTGCLAGEAAAWKEIVARYNRPVYNLAYRFTGRFDQAEDLTQEIFLKVYRSLRKFERERGEFRSWVTVMARNLLIDHIRKEKKGWFQAGGSEELDRLPQACGDGGPLAGVERAECVRFVHDCLRELSPDLRESLVLREIEGFSYEEIAQTLRVPLGTVKSRINRARIELARIARMRKLGGPVPAAAGSARRNHELPGV